MNWRKSSAELSRLYDRSPWLYMIEWRERLDRCVMHLDGGAVDGRLSPDEARMEAEQLRSTAEHLLHIAGRLTEQARKRELITALRNVDGRTPEEAAAFIAKADEIEADDERREQSSS
ncbi:MAG TPA: hypothetical protein VL738_22050 [Dactylosporangium sp.]|nr:hypothetical protein [Dactylosporangium sp.]